MLSGKLLSAVLRIYLSECGNIPHMAAVESCFGAMLQIQKKKVQQARKSLDTY
jgi:hypothetical protein